MERLKLKELETWYSDSERKPLIIWGARQVGKTYLVKELFAKKFKDYVYIDFGVSKDDRRFFNSTVNPDDYLGYIESKYGKKISNKVPLIFDEVQFCPSVVTSLKYFCQDHRELPVIVTGSMVRLAIRHGTDKENEFLFPVGKINEINLFPLTFEEYLLNSNPTLLDRVRKAYHDGVPTKDYEHKLLMDLLYEYLSIGGLPEVVDDFLKNRSYVNAKKILDSVYGNYIADMDQYNVSNETILKTRNVYSHIFQQLNKENKNFKISQIDKGKSNRDYLNAYWWLELARVTYTSGKLTAKVTLPLINAESGLFRLYLSDPGLFAFQSKVSQSDFFVRDKRNTLSGIFYENYVADEFVANGIELFFWTGKNSNEFEFVVQTGDGVVPVDVKKKKGKINSLDAFRNDNGKCLAVKISANNYGYDKERDILTIPLYETFLLADDIASSRCLRPGSDCQ